MELRKFSLEKYKGYAEPTQIELAPLTILVGANNSGKTALAQAISLLAGGLAPSDQNMSEPLPLEAGGIRHGLTFRDLVSGRSVHGQLRLSATFSNSGREQSVEATIRNVEASNQPPGRQISEWNLRCDAHEVILSKEGLDERSPYSVRVSGVDRPPRQVAWRGLLPQQPSSLGDWVEGMANDLKAWTAGVRHLRCPRRLPSGPFPIPERSPAHLGLHGEYTALALAADESLGEAVSDWYRNIFGVAIDIRGLGRYFDLHVRASFRRRCGAVGAIGPGTFTCAPGCGNGVDRQKCRIGRRRYRASRGRAASSCACSHRRTSDRAPCRTRTAYDHRDPFRDGITSHKTLDRGRKAAGRKCSCVLG